MGKIFTEGQETAPWTLEEFTKRVGHAYSGEEFYEFAKEFYALTLKQCSAIVSFINDDGIDCMPNAFEAKCRAICHIVGKEEYHNKSGFHLYLSSLATINTVIEMGHKYDLDLMPGIYPKLYTRLVRYSNYLPEEFSSPIMAGITDNMISRIMLMDEKCSGMRDTELSLFNVLEKTHESGRIGSRSWAPYDERVVLETYAQKLGIMADTENESKVEANSN